MGCGSSVQIAVGIPPTEPEGTDNSDTRLKITSEQMRLIKSTWKQMDRDRTRLGSKVFFRIFDLNPDIKSLFTFKNTWGDELLGDPLFKAHAGRFMNTLDTTVTNLHMVETTVGPHLYNLGKRHAVHDGFKPDYFHLYRSSILYVFHQELGMTFTEEVGEAWSKLLVFITTKLGDGYEKGQQTLLQDA